MVGSLSTVALENARATGIAKKLADAQQFWASAANVFADPNSTSLFANATNDDDVLTVIANAVNSNAAPESLGVLGNVLDDLKGAGGRLLGSATNIVNSPVILAIRMKLTPDIAIFLGDVFAYLRTGTPRTSIRAEVLGKLGAAARRAQSRGGKLIAAGHSMGGVILYDLLSDPAVVQQTTETLGFPFKVDLLLTIGSQVAVFEELKMFTNSDPAIPSPDKAKVASPVGATRWLNVYNRLDALSFLAAPVFDMAQDFEASTTGGVLDAHGAYFTNMIFYKRLNVKLKEAGLL